MRGTNGCQTPAQARACSGSGSSSATCCCACRWGCRVKHAAIDRACVRSRPLHPFDVVLRPLDDVSREHLADLRVLHQLREGVGEASRQAVDRRVSRSSTPSPYSACLWVVHQGDDLTEEGDGLLTKLLGVADVAPDLQARRGRRVWIEPAVLKLRSDESFPLVGAVSAPRHRRGGPEVLQPQVGRRMPL